MLDAQTTGGCTPTVPPWGRVLAAVVVTALGGYLALVSAAFAPWTEVPPGWGRAADGWAALAVSALTGLVTAGMVLALAGEKVKRRWIAAGLLPAVWGLLSAIGLW